MIAKPLIMVPAALLVGGAAVFRLPPQRSHTKPLRLPPHPSPHSRLLPLPQPRQHPRPRRLRRPAPRTGRETYHMNKYGPAVASPVATTNLYR